VPPVTMVSRRLVRLLRRRQRLRILTVGGEQDEWTMWNGAARPLIHCRAGPNPRATTSLVDWEPITHRN
jgi:hypothetical protein